MIVALILSVASITILIFLSGYKLAMKHNEIQFLDLMQEGESLEPIFQALDLKYAYTDRLSKPFTNEN